MDKDEKFLAERFGKKHPFEVPDGYFDDFASRLMSQLPEKEDRIIKLQPIHRSYRRWIVLAAASAMIAVFSLGTYMHNEDRIFVSNSQNHVVHKVNNGYNVLDETVDYSMIDNEDIYAYVSDN
jgi:hypothetical protein